MTEEFSRRSVLCLTGGLSGIGLLSSQGETWAKPSSFIVGTDSRVAERVTRSAADSVHRELDFGAIGTAIAGRFSSEALDALRKRDDVRYVEPDGAVEALGESLPWGIDRVDADVSHANGHTGDGVDIAILDTGIDSDHPDLKANIGKGYAVETCSGSNCNYDWDDDDDHGTHCAGIANAADNSSGVVGVSTEATLHAVKVLDGNGSGKYSGVAEGLKWVADQGYEVSSMSLGGESGSQTIKDACQYASDKGVLLVAAAGNDGSCSDCVRYPAAYSTVIAVSATDDDDQLASFSSTGPEVELAAPGKSVYSTVIGDYSYYSGTSMACPHVAGAGGALMANGYTNTEARDQLRTTAEDIGLSENEQGYGLLDVPAAFGNADEDLPVTVATDSSTDVGDTSVTLNGDLTDLGGASSADCYFEYRQSGASSWTATSAQTRSSTGSFSESVTGLSPSTGYEFRAVADASDGDTDTGSSMAFTTTEDALAVTTDEPTKVGGSSATLNGDLSDLGGASSADCYFEYRESGASSWTATSPQTRSSTGSFSHDVDGLSSGTDYEYRAVTTGSGGDSDTGSSTAFSTDVASSPFIDIFALVDGDSLSPDTELVTDWSVSDAGGDLATVVVEVFDTSMSLVDSSNTDVSGASASGSDEFTLTSIGDEVLDVRLTVTDAAGNSASQTKTVSFQATADRSISDL